MRVLRATHRLGIGLLAVLLSAAAFRAPCLGADDAPAPAPAPAGAAAAGPATPIGLIAVKSVDAVADAVKDMGLPFPVGPAMFEMQAPVFPKGALATDKPVGVVLFANPNGDPSENRTFVFPVKPGAATAESLKADGAEPVPGQGETLKSHEMYLLRSGDYLICSFKPDLPAQVKVESIADALKGPDALVRVVVDVKALRTSMPDQFNQMIQMAEQGAKSGAAGNAAAAQAAARVVTDPLRTLDRVVLGLDHGASGLRLALTAAPVKMPEGEAGKLPDLPAEIIARVDVAGPVVQAIPASDDWIKKLIEDSAKEGAGKGPALTADQQQRVVNILNQARTLFVADGGVTAGIELLGNGPVVYVVNRYAKPVDLATQLPHLVAQINAITNESKKPNPVQLQTYAIGPTKVFRVVVLNGGKPVGYLDAAQRGDAVLMTAADQPFRCIDRLIDAKGAVGGPGAAAPGAGRELASGWLDLGALLNAVGKDPNSPVASMPADQRQQIVDLLQGQRLRVSASTEGDAATFDLTVPAGLLHKIPKLMEKFGPAAQGSGSPSSEPGSPGPGPSPSAPPPVPAPESK